MLPRIEIFPHVIEMNYQARRRMGCSVYLVFHGNDWLLIDIGYEDTVAEIVELIRRMDFPLSNCRYLIATHADVDHVQGMQAARQLLPNAEVLAHPHAKPALELADRIVSFAEIEAQGISIDFPAIPVDQTIDDGDRITIGDLSLDVWYTPGHALGQLAFRMGDLLFSGDNVYRDGCVGNIDPHHGSDLEDFIASLERIRDCDAKWLLPSHGPVFRKDAAMLQKVVDRLNGYLHMADFGTCAIDWPLLQEWEGELLEGFDPERA